MLTLAKHSETGEVLVIYQALYGDYSVYARPLDMFTSEVDHEKYPDVTQKDRCELVEGLDLSVDIKHTSTEQPTSDTAEKTVQESPVLTAASENPVSEVSKSSARRINIKSADELLEEFLDAKTCRDRINILTAMHCMLTDYIVDTIAASLDTEIADGDIEERYYKLRNYLATKEKYECNRLR